MMISPNALTAKGPPPLRHGADVPALKYTRYGAHLPATRSTRSTPQSRPPGREGAPRLKQPVKPGCLPTSERSGQDPEPRSA
jgi:hypothetical protein